MKVSLAWVFDHIDADWKSIDVAELTTRFNETTAEIESSKPVRFVLDELALAQVKQIEGDRVALFVPEWDREYPLSLRTDAQIDQWFLVKSHGDGCTWATTMHLGSSKEQLLPTVSVTEDDVRGHWRNQLEQEDHIWEIDNKSITHRPDLWGHRGIAREVAAILNLPLLPVEHTLQVRQRMESARAASAMPFHVSLNAGEGCDKFVTVYVPGAQALPSLVWMAHRLCRIDSKPIATLVDGTNYAMFDVGHPMHAFDADALNGSKITVRMAERGEKMQLLDEQEVELDPDDIVIADAERARSLAGVMGGNDSGVGAATQTLLLEAARFDGGTIRRTAIRHGIRTEASARFEKELDGEQTVHVLDRYLQLMQEAGAIPAVTYSATMLGAEAHERHVMIDHAFIERCLGVAVPVPFVQEVLSKLGFTVATDQGCDGTYHVVVPHFRVRKDIEIPEDIVEEVARFWGYHTIPSLLPSVRLSARVEQTISRMRTIKRLLAFGCDMRELHTYPFFNEPFLQELGYKPTGAIQLQNPVSENRQRLVTSLVPQLMEAIVQDGGKHEQLRFFESARTWKQESDRVTERRVLAGVIFAKGEPIDFYCGKAIVQRIFKACSIDVTWDQMTESDVPWFSPYVSATLLHEGVIVGRAGQADGQWTQKLSEGYAFFFELDAAYLSSYALPVQRFEPLPKYPTVERDVSILIPVTVTVDTLSQRVQKVDLRITSVDLIDFFQKDAWGDSRAVTIRITMCDIDKSSNDSGNLNIFHHWD